MLKRSLLRKRSKYNVDLTEFGKMTRTVNGHTFHSGLEVKYRALLELRMRTLGPLRIKGYEIQVPVKLEVNGMLIGTWIMDFRIEHMDGRLEWVECKGVEGREWPWKRNLFRALYPERKLTIVRQVR